MDESPQEVLIGGIEKRDIVLVDYDPKWVVKFEHHAEAIKMALRSMAISIEHVGSTAVPKLVAKPIVDIIVTVNDAAEEQSYLPDC